MRRNGSQLALLLRFEREIDETGGLSHGTRKGFLGTWLLVEEAHLAILGLGWRIVERALPEAIQAEHFLRRDLEGHDDVLQFAALVEHAESVGGDLAGGISAGCAARGGGAEHLGGVVMVDAGGVSFGV